MNRLIRFYNQNRKKVVISIIIIVLLFLLLKLLDNIIEKRNISYNLNISNNQIINNISNSLTIDKSVVTGEKINSNKLKKDLEIIEEFIKSCNDQNIERAYDFLTDECKEEMFSTMQDFYQIYYMNIFNSENRNYKIENWVGNTYKITYLNDILVTGKIDNNLLKQDYITIINNNKEKKLNINNYVGRKKTDIAIDKKDINLTIEQIDTYMDYEKYRCVIKNNSKSDILIDTGDDTESIYLVDSNNMKYYFYSNEINTKKLKINSKMEEKIDIKFMSSYVSNKKIKEIVFSKIVLDYNSYELLKDKDLYKDFYILNIKI